MISRRALARSCAGFFLLASGAGGPARAFSFQPYEKAAVDKAIQSGAPVIIHVYASWCLQCRAQAALLGEFSADRRLDGVRFFKIDYDGQKDAHKALGAPRSTLIAYKGGKEVARMSWGTTKSDVMRVLQRAA